MLARERNRTGRRLCVAIATLILLCCASTTFAKVKLDLEVGWEEKFRIGKWTPLFLTLQETQQPRQIVIEVYSPTDRRYALNVRQGLTIGPQPVTVPVYVPLSYRLDETTVTIRDANSGRRLEHTILNDFPVYGGQPGPKDVGQALFIVISGNASGERMLQAQLRNQNIETGYIAPNRLPTTPTGYESMDVLLLNQPEIARLNLDQQGAIAAWVRGGGLLVILAGTSPVPPVGPLVEILPARVGEVRQLDLNPATVQKAGLPARFAKLTGRDLVDVPPDARATPLFDSTGPKAIRRWVGLGQVMIVPVDVSSMTFDDPNQALGFWRTMLTGMIDLPTATDTNQQRRPMYYGVPDDPRRAIAMRQTLDFLGDVPGAGSFGFSYVAITLLVMMFIVGPVDWFVLKWTGRQPWTWVTITGWIGVITLGSIYLGHVFKSGDVHFRTASLIDEAGGARVASIDLAGIYSPRTTDYELEITPQSWWRTASVTNPWGGGSNMLSEIVCHQDYRGNRPLPMLINVWNVRFLEGQEIGEEPAMVQAKLARATGRQVSGTITNRAAFPLRDIVVRTNDGVIRMPGPLEPGATLQVGGALAKDKTLTSTTQLSDSEAWSLFSQDVPTTRPTPQSMNGVADVRALRIDQQLAERDDVACVYATYEAPPGERLKLNNVTDAHELHVGVIRALVPLQKPAQ